MEECVCYQLSSEKQRVFPGACPSLGKSFLLEIQIAHICQKVTISWSVRASPSIVHLWILVGCFWFYLKFCFPTKSFCVFVKKRYYFFIVFQILQNISIMSAQRDEDVTFCQVKSLNCVQLFFILYAKKCLFLLIPLS